MQALTMPGAAGGNFKLVIGCWLKNLLLEIKKFKNYLCTIMESAFLLPMATLLVRVILGILFFMQGYDKIFRIGITITAETASTPVTDKIFGRNFLKALIRISSWIELVAGALLIVGFQRDTALILLSADMLVTGIIFTLIKPMWDMQFYFPRLVMLVFLMIIPPGWDIFNLDSLLH